MSATSILSPGQTPATATFTVVDGTPSYILLYTDTGVPIPDGVSLDILRESVNGFFMPFRIEVLGRVTLNAELTCVTITVPGNYKVTRPDITEFLVNVGVEVDT